MAGQDDSAQLCDSVCQASAQVQWRPFHLSLRRQRNCQRRWSETNPRSLSVESDPPQAPVQNAHMCSAAGLQSEAALTQLREQVIHIVNYLDGWLILAQSQELVCKHRDQSISFKVLQVQDSGPTETISEAPGHFASAAAVTPLRLLHMRPLQPLGQTLHFYGGSALRPSVQACCGYNRRFQDRLGCCVQQACSLGSWTGPRLQWIINCLELLTVILALRRLRPLIQGKHVLVRTDNTATAACINRQGGLRSRHMSQLARHLLLWSHGAPGVTGHLNRWTIDLFASHESTHCTLWYSLTEAPLGTDALAHSWPRGPRKYAFPPVSLIAQTLCKVREERHQVLMVAPYWPNQTWFTDLTLLVSVRPWRIPLRRDLLSQGQGTNWHPHPDLWDLHVWSLDGTRQSLETYHQRGTCASCGEDQQRWGLGAVQQGLEKHLSASTLKVYAAAVAVNHDLVDGRSLGKHGLIIRFLRGSRKINPPRPRFIPSCDLSVALLGLQKEPFEPLQSVELGALSMKTALLIVLTSLKRVGDLQALSVCYECLEFGPAYSHVVLRPRPGYVPKVPTTPFRDQVVNLQAFPSKAGKPSLVSVMSGSCLAHLHMEPVSSLVFDDNR
ncbi:Serine--tRNA ligase [Labeo rohita]|uniref:Serine--tRNA ligase n=1 Tax=Labeo rohita TaxID=84645 RepID=A0ABQ8MMT7_LABRO|nr:Serine--tRNA ligase [Labeo rohita]